MLYHREYGGEALSVERLNSGRLNCEPLSNLATSLRGGLFGPLALTPSGPPSLRSGVPQHTSCAPVEPLSVQILSDSEIYK